MQTYESLDMRFELDSKQVFRIISELTKLYTRIDEQKPMSYLVGSGRKMEVLVERQRTVLNQMVCLADLVLTENSRFFIEIHKHDNLLVDPVGLIKFINGYKL